ncbi:hypothetical protein QQS21_001360 [Conoideocrella luteorostrata]|uniref:Uncharacterized protein n=1 Tax=Conoideocrella luteorostrata TaxID=1105319 RepID=A0AAJ0CZR7_9HYPO|nr:hypothetical protein QQS21_001360 [Conoideocrella luteorostrata]
MDSTPVKTQWITVRGLGKYNELTADQLLWYERTDEEGSHRHCIHLHAVMLTYEPSMKNATNLPAMSISQFVDTCNKSIPIYIIPCPKVQILKIVLHNYIYRRWFRPYKSEIDCARFICKFITPQDLPKEVSPSQSTINGLVSLNMAICNGVDAQRNNYRAQRENSKALDDRRINPDVRILQPLFRALLLIISGEKYCDEDSKTVGGLQVCLVQTGLKDGLSDPITFDSIPDDKILRRLESVGAGGIETTLETAIDFVIDLEAREVAAFGLQPDPVAIWEPLELSPETWREKEPPVGPSSRFVDTSKYTKWTGGGEHYENRVMPVFEQRAFRHYALDQEEKGAGIH